MINENQKDLVSLNDSIQDYTNSTKPKQRKIKEERRRRNQAYRSLDYYLSTTNFFDFFSYDAFVIAKKAKYFAQICDINHVTSDFLLLPFFYSSFYKDLLTRFQLEEQNIGNAITSRHNLYPKSFLFSLKERSLFLFKNFANKWKKSNYTNLNVINFDIEYTKEITFLFEKASENALERFKTPIISSEILLITMMEERQTAVGQLIRQFIPDQMDWYYLRFFLLKRLHSKELSIRNDVKKNLRYFAYLLVKEISEEDVERYRQEKKLEDLIYAFRKQIISQILEKNIFEDLVDEVYESIKLTSNREYSI